MIPFSLIQREGARVAELQARPAFGAAFEKTIGAVTLLGVAEPGHMTSIAPFLGKTEEVSKVLKAQHGLRFPGPNESVSEGGARCLWFGREMALLIGPPPDQALSQHAALTDQSDGWTALQLSGAGAEAVLARLAPIDLRRDTFPVGATARSMLEHVNASITRESADGFMLLVYRSMTGTVLHELERAMENVAALG